MSMSTSGTSSTTGATFGSSFTGEAAEDARDLFVTGLRNAHAVEIEAEQLIQRQLGGLDDYPELARRMRQHLDETRRQQERLKALLDRMNDSSSTMKDATLGLMGNLSALATMPSDDAVLKNTFANLAFENYEIAAYCSLIAMAEACGYADALAPLRQSLEEERDMARFIDDNTPAVTRKFMALAIDERRH